MEIMTLERGGYIVDTPAGYVQFGSPPETIKDSMQLPKGVPQLFVLPNRFFNWIKGISVAEVEFPIYYNFFLKKRKTYILCQRDQLKPFAAVLTEAIFGPETIDLRDEFPNLAPDGELPPIEQEMSYFRGSMKLGDLVGFVFFDENRLSFRGIDIEITPEETFRVSSGSEVYGEVPGLIEYNPTYDIGKRLPEPYKPPLFGMTCLGPSHGFDPTENTSGFILWLNRQGIMIDPPVNTTEWLIDSNVNPKLIDSIILTHCHADHDAGTLQKILEEGKITVYTTKTIMQSFLRKYTAQTGVTTDYLSQLFEYQSVLIDEPLFIHCARFSFFYSLHSIPTIGFKVEFEGKSMVYSSDHNADPALHTKLFRENRIGSARYRELSSFPWNSDLVYHESGIAPLHTPIEVLDSLPGEIRKHTMVYHIAKKDFPDTSDLTLSRFGIEETRELPVEPPVYERVYHVLGLLKHLDFFQNMPISKAQAFISMVEEKSFAKGEKIIARGTPGDYFYVIKSGNISVTGKDLKQRKIYGTYDYFGEAALLNKRPRAADVYAETDVELYTIEGERFLCFIQGTELERTLRRLSRIRDSETWNVLSTSPFFRILTSTQKTLLESLLIPVDFREPGTILAKGEELKRSYIIREGEVLVTSGDREITRLGRGDFIGAMVKIYRGEPAEYSFINKGPVSLFAVEKKDVLSFLRTNPGLMMKLVYDFLKI
jgi:CRP-like cAMP-binding protein